MPQGFAVTTATPLQRAICRLIDGQPLGDLANHPHVLEALGLPATATFDGLTDRPKEFLILSGIRTGKSLFTACLAVYASQTCDMSKIRAGEIPRVSVLSLKKDLAKVVYNHIIGTMAASPHLSTLMVGEPNADGLLLRHPSGKLVEITTVPMDRAGGSLVARWSAGCILDEAPRMVGSEDGVANYDDVKRAVIERLLPGAQLASVGSPWAPFGPIYNLTQEHWGKPNSDVLVVKAPGPLMNPYWWTPDRVESARKRPHTYRTDVLAEFSDGDEGLFPQHIVQGSQRETPVHLEPDGSHEYVAAMDPATRRDAWTLVIATIKDGKYIVAFHKQWQAEIGNNLSPDRVLHEIAAICYRYNIDSIQADQWSADALKDIAARYNLTIQQRTMTQQSKYAMVENLRTLMFDGRVEIPKDEVLERDLLATRKRLTHGAMTVQFPRTGGRHCDYVPPLAMCVDRYIEEPAKEGPAFYTADWHRAEERKRKALMSNKGKRDDEDPEGKAWWDGPDLDNAS